MGWRRYDGAMEAAFFDLDKTIISRSSSLALSRPMYRAGLVSRAQLLRGAYAQLVYLLIGADERRMERAKNALLALTKGWERRRVEQVVRETLDNVLQPLIYQEALDLIALHRALGRRVFIISSATEEIVRPLAERLGVEDVIATRVRIEGGRYTGELAFYCYGPAKAEAIREVAAARGVDLAGSYAYSDSVTDLPMLEAVGNPIAVNPDRELRRVAIGRGWQTRDFRRPVPLHRRFPAVPRPTGPVAAVSVAAAAGFVAGWLYLRRRIGSRRSDRGFPSRLLRV